MCGMSLDTYTYPSKPLKALRENADTESVDSRIRLLKQMVSESLYVVDEEAVADAILAHSRMRQVVGAPALRGERRRATGRVKSFRRSRAARSFRLAGELEVAGHPR
jgi:hypothetical protein